MADALLPCLGRARIVSRGPKASGAVVTAGLTVDWQAPSERLAEVVDDVVAAGVDGRRVVVQLDGGGRDERVVDRLKAAGAEVVEVPVYRWTFPDDTTPARRLIAAVCESAVDAVTFTAAPALRNLFAIAERDGHADDLREAFNGSVLTMCVGPVCREAAADCGVHGAQHPGRARLGSMVQALTEHLEARRRVLPIGPVDVVMQGALVVAGGQRVVLANRERAVFDVLARRPGVVVAKDPLLREVWGDASDVEVHTLEVTVGRLRRRLAPTGLTIETVVRRGYRLTHRAS